MVSEKPAQIWVSMWGHHKPGSGPEDENDMYVENLVTIKIDRTSICLKNHGTVSKGHFIPTALSLKTRAKIPEGSLKG